jgi:hypothetical protein
LALKERNVNVTFAIFLLSISSTFYEQLLRL